MAFQQDFRRSLFRLPWDRQHLESGGPGGVLDFRMCTDLDLVTASAIAEAVFILTLRGSPVPPRRAWPHPESNPCMPLPASTP